MVATLCVHPTLITGLRMVSFSLPAGCNVHRSSDNMCLVSEMYTDCMPILSKSPHGALEIIVFQTLFVTPPGPRPSPPDKIHDILHCHS